MIRVALAGLLGRRLRTALTAFAIVLGVAMVSGTLTLTGSIDHAFNYIFTSVRQGSDAVITGKAAVDVKGGQNGSFAPTVSTQLLDQVRALPGVTLADGEVSGLATLIDRKNKAIVFGGAPNLGFSIDHADSPFNPLRLVSGAWPHGNEVVIDRTTAKRRHFVAGDTIGVQAEGPIEHFRISGIVEFGSAASLGGATLAGFDVPTAQHVFQKSGRFDEIAIAKKPGVTEEALLQQVRALLPKTAQVRTGTAQAQEDQKQTDKFVSFLRDFLLAFGGIALFVGSFVIANSLSITIAQRTRELATMRTLGASRRQVLTSIVVEALVMGVVSSVIGLVLGLGLAKLLFWLFDKAGFTLPNSGVIFAGSTVAIALVAGVVVTLVASLRPAIRATRVPPIAAVREGAAVPPSRFARFRAVGSILLTLAGFAAVLFGLFGPHLGTKQVLAWMGVGTVCVFFGISLLAARVVRPLAAGLGWPATRIGGAAGALARDNARRNPQRTASTAAALMIGLALVTLVAVLAAGITSSFRGAVEKIWQNADYAITAQNNFTPISPAATDAVAHTPGVEAVGNVRTGNAKAFGKSFFATAVNPDAGSMFKLDWTVGSPSTIATLGSDGAFVDLNYAKHHQLHAGSPIRLTFADGTTKVFRLTGIFDPPAGGSPFGRVTISQAAWDAENQNPQNLYSFVRMRGGQSNANRKIVERVLKRFPNAKVATRQQFIDNQIKSLNQVLNILYVLLALSVVVSVFGIVNTLVLTVFERTREIGMLRAIGMTRRQVRRMVRHESVITAMIGGALGIVLGIVLGGLLVARVDFIVFTVPIGSLVVFALLTIVVGILAAIFPARRAARLNVLEALQYE